MLKRATSFLLTFPMYEDDTGDLKTGLSPSAQVSKDGGAFAASTNSAAEIGATGEYKLQLTATEMNATNVMVKITATDALTVTAILTTTDAIQGIADAVWEESHVEHMKPGTFGGQLDMPISVIPGAEKQRRGD